MITYFQTLYYLILYSHSRPHPLHNTNEIFQELFFGERTVRDNMFRSKRYLKRLADKITRNQAKRRFVLACSQQ
jgi:hypothetical protein